MLFSITIFILSAVIVTSALHYLKYKGRIFSLGFFFNAYAFMYFVVGCLIYRYDILDGDVTEELTKISILSLIAVAGFNSSYTLALKVISKNRQSNSYLPLYGTVLLVFLIGVLAQSFILLKIGMYDFFFVDRVERFAFNKDNQVFYFISKLVNIALIFALIRMFTINRRKDKNLVKVILTYNLFFAIMTISRSEIAFNFICLFYFLDKKRIISIKNIFFIGFFMALLMFSYKGFLYLLLLGDAGYGSYNPGEFINWIRNSVKLIELDYTSTDFSYNSYWLAFKGLFFVNPDGEALSIWFIQEFFSERYSKGLTYGFSGVIEGYMYAKYVGVYLHFFFIGALFSIVESESNTIKIALSICAMFIMFRLFRSEIYNFARTFAWYYAYQIFFLVALDHIFKFKHRVKKYQSNSHSGGLKVNE